jgi:hypothetical protein
MTELTYEEFCEKPLLYTMGLSGDWGAQRLYRNEELGIQKETRTERLRHGDIYGGWHDSVVAFFVDGDPREFRTSADLYVAWMEKVCGMPRGAGAWKEQQA